MNRPEGYRYVRQYWRGSDHHNWALYEIQDGKAKRVGTAHSERAYREFIGAVRVESYVDFQFQKLGVAKDAKVKLTSEDGETHWMNITPAEVEAIQRVLTERQG